MAQKALHKMRILDYYLSIQGETAMKKMIKLLTLLLTLVVCAALLPAATFAESGYDATGKAVYAATGETGIPAITDDEGDDVDDSPAPSEAIGKPAEDFTDDGMPRSGEDPAITPLAVGDIAYLDENGVLQTVTATRLDGSFGPPDVTLGAGTTGGWYYAEGYSRYFERIIISGNIKIILTDKCELEAVNGIVVTGSNSLTVFGQSTNQGTAGLLNATGAAGGGAGIGGASGGGSCGAVTIYGGKVTAAGGSGESGAGVGGGAGIGGGGGGGNAGGGGGAITINGGWVTATAGAGGYTGSDAGGGGAGIGGGGGAAEYNGGDSGTIKVTGGTVDCRGGAGYYLDRGSARYLGGGPGSGAGGGGAGSYAGFVSGGTAYKTGGAAVVTISGGAVTASSGFITVVPGSGLNGPNERNAGIGCGFGSISYLPGPGAYYICTGGRGNSILIYGEGTRLNSNGGSPLYPIAGRRVAAGYEDNVFIALRQGNITQERPGIQIGTLVNFAAAPGWSGPVSATLPGQINGIGTLNILDNLASGKNIVADSKFSGDFTFSIGGGYLDVVTAFPESSKPVYFNKYASATLTVRKNNEEFAGHGKTFTLRQDGEIMYTGSGTGGTLTFSNVINGVYNIYDGDDDTGVTMNINGPSAAGTLDYYDVSFAKSDPGVAVGLDIHAIYGGSEIESGALVVGGKQLIIAVEGMDPGLIYTFAWSGAGTSGQTTNSITINILGNAVNAACAVTEALGELIVSAPEGWQYIGSVLTITENGEYAISMKGGVTTTSVSSIAVAAGVTAGVTLDSVSIDMSDAGEENSRRGAFEIKSGGAVVLTLTGGNTLKSGNRRGGLEVPASASVRIKGAGSLTASGGECGAGIGGSGYQGPAGVNCGSVVIESGNIIATGGAGFVDPGSGSVGAGAGIGGGGNYGSFGGAGGNILIYGNETKVCAKKGASTGFAQDVGKGGDYYNNSQTGKILAVLPEGGLLGTGDAEIGNLVTFTADPALTSAVLSVSISGLDPLNLTTGIGSGAASRTLNIYAFSDEYYPTPLIEFSVDQEGYLPVLKQITEIMSEGATVTFSKTPAYTAVINPASRLFPDKLTGYTNTTIAPQQFTLRNTGTGNLTNLSASVKDRYFEISQALSAKTAAPQASVTLSVRPINGLAAGTYTDELIVTGDNGFSISAVLEFTVAAENTIKPVLETDSLTFPVVEEGYSYNSYLQAVLRNDGTINFSGQVRLENGEGSAFELRRNTILAGSGSKDVADVRPKPGLPAGKYTDNLIIEGTGSGEITFTVPLSFTVTKGITVRYVKPDGNDLNDGKSWLAAYKTLQKAIDAAGDSTVEEIRVAAGTYYPTKTIGNGTGDRDMAFLLPKEVKVYGGYDAATGLRDCGNYESILSGDIGVPGNRADNTWHVVVMAGDAGDTLLDGFTIAGGNANGGATAITVNGVDIQRRFGAGLYIAGSGHRVSNCVFIENAGTSGGGVYIAGTADVEGCLFTGNSANDAGGLYSAGLAQVRDCTFTGNTASTSGGSIYLLYNDSLVANCVFTGNSTIGGNYGGGGICVNGGSPTIVNCLLADNAASNNGGGFYSYRSNPKLVNCTIINNTAASDGGGIFYEMNAAREPVVTNCIVTGNNAGDTASAGTLGGITNTSSIIGDQYYDENGKASHIDTGTVFLGRGPQLGSGSPAIGKGMYPVPGVTIPDADLSGATRIIGGRIDLGAYEYQGTERLRLVPGHVILTNETSSGDGNDAAVICAECSPVMDYGNLVWTVDTFGLVGGKAGEFYTASPVLNGAVLEGYIVTRGIGSPAENTPVLEVEIAEGNRSVTVTAVGDGLTTPQTLRLWASYADGRYMASATVEMLPDMPAASAPGIPNTSVKVLDTAVAVNRALERGTLVTILISQQDFSGAGAVRPFEADAVGPAGTEALGAMRLVDSKGKGLENFDVRMCQYNHRYIEISARSASAKSLKNASLQVLPLSLAAPAMPPSPATAAQRAAWDSAWDALAADRIATIGKFNIAVTNKYPKVTIKAGDLNLGFPTVSAPLIVTSAAGVPVEPVLVTGAVAKSVYLDPAASALCLKSNPATGLPVAKKGILKGALTVKQFGYYEQTLSFKVKVIASTMPKVKLDRSKVALFYTDAIDTGAVCASDLEPVTVKLIPGAKNGKSVTEDWYTIKRVEAVRPAGAVTDPKKLPNLDVRYLGGGQIEVRPTDAAGLSSVTLRVFFDDPRFGSEENDNTKAAYDAGSDTLFRDLRLKVNRIAAASLKATNRNVIANVGVTDYFDRSDPAEAAKRGPRYSYIEPDYLVASIPVALNAANLKLDDWGIISINNKTGDPVYQAKAAGLTPAWSDAKTNSAEAWMNAIELKPGVNRLDVYVNRDEMANLVIAHNTALYNDATKNGVTAKSVAAGIKAAVNTNGKYTLKIGSEKLNKTAGATPSFTVTLNLAKGEPGFKLALNKKTKIDIANRESAAAAKVALTNTSAGIKKVWLYESVNKKAAPQAGDMNYAADMAALFTEHEQLEADFEPGSLAFTVKSTNPDNGLVPGVEYPLSVRIELTNGQMLESWTEKAATKGGVTTFSFADKPLTIVPVQTVQKGWKTEATLYKTQPMSGSVIEGMKLKSPANAVIGQVQPDYAKLKKLRFAALAPGETAADASRGIYPGNDGLYYKLVNGFDIKRSGESEWTLYFQDGVVPAGMFVSAPSASKANKMENLKSSYMIDLQLWAEGTYMLVDADGVQTNDKTTGKPAALGSFNKNGKWASKSKPTTINVKVSIK